MTPVLFPLLFYLLSDEIYKKVGIRMGFIATRSGFMRFSDHSHLFKDPEEETNSKKRRKKKKKYQDEDATVEEEKDDDDERITEP